MIGKTLPTFLREDDLLGNRRCHTIWNEDQEDGKRKVKCVGNGNVKDLEKKSEKES